MISLRSYIHLFHSNLGIVNNSPKCCYPLVSFELISNWNVWFNRPYNFFQQRNPSAQIKKTQKEDFRFFLIIGARFPPNRSSPKKKIERTVSGNFFKGPPLLDTSGSNHRATACTSNLFKTNCNTPSVRPTNI